MLVRVEFKNKITFKNATCITNKNLIILICSLLQYWSGAIINTGGKGQFEAMTASLHELLANDCLCFSFLMYCIFVCDDYCACVDIVACSGSY
jgi:hypothetical protein